MLSMCLIADSLATISSVKLTYLPRFDSRTGVRSYMPEHSVAARMMRAGSP